MKFFTKEVRIALVAIVGLVVLYFGMNFLKGLNMLSSDSKYFIAFEDISGLSSSSPIYADGYKVGVVKGIDYDYEGPGNILVEASVNSNLRIPKGSSAEIESDMMGNVKVNLLLANNPREKVMPGETIIGGINSGSLGKMAQMIPMIEKMLPKLDSILYNVNKLLADPAIAQSLKNVETVSGNLTVTTQQINTLLAEMNRNVPGMMKRADSVLDNTNQLMTKLKGVDIEGTMAKVDATIENMNGFTQKLNSGKGTLGLMMNDPSLYNNLNSTMRSADSLLINLREHPKRYVHFSIFGKKDK
ncbi:MAG: MCE family protein [Prevotella sp.]|nr:MCE family protein [Prevotella sp.]MBQ8629181.1 MCE family protein [Prevotella sp.]